MYEFWIGVILGVVSGMGVCAWWTIPVLDKYRETIGKLEVDLKHARTVNRVQGRRDRP